MWNPVLSISSIPIMIKIKIMQFQFTLGTWTCAPNYMNIRCSTCLVALSSFSCWVMSSFFRETMHAWRSAFLFVWVASSCCRLFNELLITCQRKQKWNHCKADLKLYLLKKNKENCLWRNLIWSLRFDEVKKLRLRDYHNIWNIKWIFCSIRCYDLEWLA